jgi:hypothetical protein
VYVGQIFPKSPAVRRIAPHHYQKAPCFQEVAIVIQPGGPTPITLATYRDVRVGMVVIMFMLIASMLIEQLSATCWQLAISAYYYTSAHSIVIAALLALGTLFIVYKGSSDTEDALLTLAGVCALIAAMVPQGRPALLCGRDDLPTQFEPAIQPNVWAVVIALILGWLIMLGLHLRAHTRDKRSPVGTLATGFFWLVMAFGFFALIFHPGWFNEHAHGIAGFLLLAAFIATAFVTGYVIKRQEDSKSPHRHGYQCFYRFIAVLMLLTLIAVVALHLAFPAWRYWTLWIELLLIFEFAAYWAVQTFELWDTPDRRQRLSQPTQDRLAEWRTEGGIAGLKSAVDLVRDQPAGQKLLPYL